jgi:hypothetical protein
MTLQTLLRAKQTEWRRDTKVSFLKRKVVSHRVSDLRYDLLLDVLRALDDADVEPTYHRDGARVRFLRAVLRIADSLDGVKPTRGSMRLIRTAYRDHRRQVGHAHMQNSN